ncbi:DUF3237 domain-containing protein [Rhodococcus sp. 06-156-3C]|uniref:DUF3237 domain-containing protein n=1 Tax=Nocardiaceae TaxID=85025 RepID=UPI00068E5D92|nr:MULTISPECIES: DUF3237 domain-containing protein [Rhodococcus]OZD19485.1 DUF3237 domain-containing protein [Rhodococcus sp. 06-156-3C]OZD21816.1 DUF3237 domain-containing protein [Rhodococcus sp. 06-156-4C]OZD25504.1 DUF3237 domain-containing protein [Rhodococcus sp. 06-156-4a]OZD33141.1 DUF3237 domain-containing protein [Rhodococcus sp. 06-156-3b]OZD42045.1 DUF3237 domain-containing protein [Rhodococcus sp. 06-156-3]
MLGTADITVGRPQNIGGTPQRRIVPVTGGTIVGDRLSGVILPGGGDWQATRPDGSVDIDARYTVETDADTLIYVQSIGVRRLPAGNTPSGADTAADPSSYYFRLAVRFETESPKYRWLTDHLAIGSAIKHPGGIRCTFYVVL